MESGAWPRLADGLLFLFDRGGLELDLEEEVPETCKVLFLRTLLVFEGVLVCSRET